MYIRRRVLTPFAVALFMASSVLIGPASAQNQKVDKKVAQAQQEEIQAVLHIADAVTAGQIAPADFVMTYSADYLKALENRTFSAFTLSIPAEPAPPTALTMYMRLVSKNPVVPAVPNPADKKDKDKGKDKDKDKNHPVYAFEDAYPVDLKAPAAGVYRVSRPFSVPAGEYEALIVLKERAPIEKDKKVKNPVYKTAVLKQAITVPDFWNGELAISSVIMAGGVEPIATPLTREEAKEQPYTLGMTKITPTFTNKLGKKSELSVVFIIYNTGQDQNKKPDVSVEYGFYMKVATADKGEKFFNKTNAQNFNATTLPPQFDPALGHQLVAGQSVPLGSFPEGDYRLEIKVTDKLAGKTIVQNVPFSVGS
jgi:hypothetical protein